jgi:PAS domain S-box-containing protein
MSTENNQVQQSASYDSILSQAVKKERSVFRLSKTYPAYIILVFALVLSYIITIYIDQSVQADRKASFDKAVSSVMTRFENKDSDMDDVLGSMRALYDNLFQVVRDYFHLYGSIPVKSDESIITMMNISEVDNSEKENFVFYTQNSGLYEYQIHPYGVRPVYYPVEFIVPYETNTHMSGFDFATKDVVNDAIIKARDNAEVVSTKVYAVREPDTTGFLIMSPFYKKHSSIDNTMERRKNFEGVVCLEIDVEKFFTTALGDGVASDKTVVFEIFDMDENGNEVKVYQSENAKLLEKKYDILLRSEIPFQIADRTLKIRFATIPDFGGQFQQYLPDITLGTSVALSFILFGFVLSVTTGRARAMNLAERMTRSQRRIVESSDDIIAVMDLSGIWKSMNPACERLFNYTPDEMINDSIEKLFLEEADLARFKGLVESADEETAERIDYQMKSANGEIKWVNWSFTVSKAEGLIYSIGRDVTLEKIAEEQAKLRAKQTVLTEQLTREASEFKSYFMTKMSHQLRNSLTGIIGYLQLLSAKVYDSDDEHDSYVELAEVSSEELFTFVSDILEVSQSSSEGSYKELSTVTVSNIVDQAISSFKDNDKYRNANIQFNEGRNTTVVVDKDLIAATFVELFKSLSHGNENAEITIVASENPYEGAAEVQIETRPDTILSEMIEIYKYNKESLIETLKVDKDDILLRMGLTASGIRMMNGNMKVETFGAEDSNFVQITLPMNKKILD